MKTKKNPLTRKELEDTLKRAEVLLKNARQSGEDKQWQDAYSYALRAHSLLTTALLYGAGAMSEDAKFRRKFEEALIHTGVTQFSYSEKLQPPPPRKIPKGVTETGEFFYNPARRRHKKPIFDERTRFQWGFNDARWELEHGIPRKPVLRGPQSTKVVSRAADRAYYEGYVQGLKSNLTFYKGISQTD
jgi:hypothetical protein